jgi:predicted alpha/beta superfamily hydrolase
MRKFLLFFVLVLGIGLAGIGGWFLSSVRQSQAAADQYVHWAQDQKQTPIQFDVSVPADTPADQTLYISGDAYELGSWDAAGIPLHRDQDGHYRTTVQLLSGVPHKFKVTRGTWGTVERGAGGVDIDDHTFTSGDSPTVTTAVLTWVDAGKSNPKQVTLTGDFRFHKKFESKLLKNFRTIVVYLPPDYENNSDQHYPVLYMQDGQNLFDSSTAFAGVEWRVDETAQDLITHGKMDPVIIVGIFNSPDRTPEFTPFDKTATGADGKGALYESFVVEELKPMIDQSYRTEPDRAHTAVGGSAMGGLIALAMAHDHADTFGSVAVLDPWLRDSKQSLLDSWKDDAWMKNTRFYVDMGTQGAVLYPGTTEVADLNQLVADFDSAGLKKGADYSAQVIQGAVHGESAWQKRVPDFLMFLYGKK